MCVCLLLTDLFGVGWVGICCCCVCVCVCVCGGGGGSWFNTRRSAIWSAWNSAGEWKDVAKDCSRGKSCTEGFASQPSNLLCKIFLPFLFKILSRKWKWKFLSNCCGPWSSFLYLLSCPQNKHTSVCHQSCCMMKYLHYKSLKETSQFCSDLSYSLLWYQSASL